MPGQPDNLPNEAENCAGYNRIDDVWGWEDRSCDRVLSFICERPAGIQFSFFNQLSENRFHYQVVANLKA